MAAFDDHPRVSWRHSVDHWRHNRTIAGRLPRLRRSMQTHRRALREIHAIGYDAAIDLYPFYPTMSVLFRRAGIPIRLGHESGGGGPAYTRALPWEENGEHITETHARLVSILTSMPQTISRYDMAPLSQASVESAARLLRDRGVTDRYVVVHPGTGDARKAWPTMRWIDLARALVADGHRVVITGAGEGERAIAAEMTREIPALVDLTGRTNVAELRAVLRGASLAVAADSVAAHLAAAEATPAVSILTGMSDPRRWRPIGAAVSTVMEPVACAPCFLPRGCADMNCVRDVSVTSALVAIRDLVNS
jgi:ADP-heptose:LPS heptosyltransferase